MDPPPCGSSGGEGDKQEEEQEKEAAGGDGERGGSDDRVEVRWSDDYVEESLLHRHLERQIKIVRHALEKAVPEDPKNADLALVDPRVVQSFLEERLFRGEHLKKVPNTENGCVEHDPKLNFYPPFIVPEALATYHLFFQNQLIPLSCRANRPWADGALAFREGDSLPETATLQEVPFVFTGLSSKEQPVAPKNLPKTPEEEESAGALIELEGDSPRLAVLKRSIRVTHAAYPALSLPPKIMTAVMETLIMARPEQDESQLDPSQPTPGAESVVSDEELARWLELPKLPKGGVSALSPDDREAREKALKDRRDIMHSVVLVSLQLRCIQRFFTRRDMVRRLGESLHYLFKHGYVRQACKVADVDLTHLVTYMGLLHENRVGQSVLHENLTSPEMRRDYVRDTVYLMLVYTWQTAMGAWQQCLDPRNVKELRKILKKYRRELWGGWDERNIADDLSRLVFPDRLLDALVQGLPDIAHQSQLQNFRSFILERSGILPAMCCALPSDFVPLEPSEAPPSLWSHVYLLQLASFFMYHNDLADQPLDVGESSLLECHCRCNLCTPHRSFVHNAALLSEVQCIGTFQMQGPPNPDGSQPAPLTLNPAAWTSAYLAKFVSADYHHSVIKFYDNQKQPQASAPLTACVITQPAIVAQLRAIYDARREHLRTRGAGVYLDPVSGEVLNSIGRPYQQQQQQQKQQPSSHSLPEPAAAVAAGTHHEKISQPLTISSSGAEQGQSPPDTLDSLAQRARAAIVVDGTGSGAEPRLPYSVVAKTSHRGPASASPAGNDAVDGAAFSSSATTPPAPSVRTRKPTPRPCRRANTVPRGGSGGPSSRGRVGGGGGGRAQPRGQSRPASTVE